MITEPKPGTPAEVLAHHGVKGQKWGVRRAASRITGTHKSSKEFAKKFPTANARSREIHRARYAVAQQKKKIDKAKDPVEQKKLAKAYLKNPDRATALRLTRGEKVVTGLLAGGLVGTGLAAPVGITTVGISGYTASRAIRRKRREAGK